MSLATPAALQTHLVAPATAADPGPRPRPTDDEILGLVAAPSAAQSHGPGPSNLDDNDPEEQTDAQPNSPPADPPQFHAVFESHPELRDAWRDAQSFREIYPDVQSAREIQKLFPTLDDARVANSQVADLARIDTLFFSNRPESHAELAAAIYRLNPAAFRNLTQMMNSISTSRVGDGLQALPSFGSVSSSPKPSTAIPVQSPGVSEDPTQQQPTPMNAAQEHAFFHETNAAAVEGVLNSIHSQLDRLLPDGTSRNTRQRLTGEIYRELDAALQSNRAFGQQLRQAFRSGQLTPENQRAIIGMVVGRAKQALPGIAKRVLGEWTNAVVAHANTRHERQRNAAMRIDIAGGAPGGDSQRALMPKDIDYRRMSDSDILNL